MIYSKNNQICEDATLTSMLVQFPKCMQSFVRKALLSLVDERLRMSMGFEKTPVWMRHLTTAFIGKQPGTEYESKGFKVEELGPSKFAGEGVNAMEKDAEKMKSRAILEVNS
jgi:hypothetical protein